MQHGISYLAVNNDDLHLAIQRGASSDYIANLKQRIAFEATVGYQYTEKPFSELSGVLCNDFAFNPFRYKTVEEGAIYNKESFPNATGGVRRKENVVGKCTWICLDIDETTIKDEEYHNIIKGTNHHIARTSNPDNPYKYRVMLPLTHAVDVDNEHWKFFIGSIAKSLMCKIDRLPKSQLMIGYKDRKVYSTLDGKDIDPTSHINIAKMEVAKLNEYKISVTPGEASKLLAQPYSTFDFAFNAAVGNRWASSHAAIHKARELGASPEYIEELMYKINDFLDVPKPRETVKATLISAI